MARSNREAFICSNVLIEPVGSDIPKTDFLLVNFRGSSRFVFSIDKTKKGHSDFPNYLTFIWLSLQAGRSPGLQTEGEDRTQHVLCGRGTACQVICVILVGQEDSLGSRLVTVRPFGRPADRQQGF